MEENVIEESVERDVFRQGLIEHTQGDRPSALTELRVHDVLEQDLLRALLLTDELIVREIECRGLHSSTGIPSGEDLLHDANRRLRAAAWVLVLVRLGQI